MEIQKGFSLEPIRLILVVGEQARQLQRRASDLLHHFFCFVEIQIVAQQPQNLLKPCRSRPRVRAQKNVIVTHFQVLHLLADVAITLRQNATVTRIEKVIFDVKSAIQNFRGWVLWQIVKLKHFETVLCDSPTLAIKLNRLQKLEKSATARNRFRTAVKVISIDKSQ